MKIFLKTTRLKTLLCLLGNFIIGVGVAFIKSAAFGIDPFNGGCMALAGALGVPYTLFTLCLNTVLFIALLFWGRRYMNIGTFINWFLLCYVVDFFMPIFAKTVGFPAALLPRLAILIGGVLTISFGLALYQCADLGVSPYDALPLYLHDHFPKIKYFWLRVLLDSVMVLIMLLCKAQTGLGTVVLMFGLGPFVQFFSAVIQKFILPKRV